MEELILVKINFRFSFEHDIKASCRRHVCNFVHIFQQELADIFKMSHQTLQFTCRKMFIPPPLPIRKFKYTPAHIHQHVRALYCNDSQTVFRGPMDLQRPKIAMDELKPDLKHGRLHK